MSEQQSEPVNGVAPEPPYAARVREVEEHQAVLALMEHYQRRSLALAMQLAATEEALEATRRDLELATTPPPDAAVADEGADPLEPWESEQT